MRKALILASLLATALTAGCDSSRIPGVYRIDVPQGNVVTPEQIARLEPGMEQRKVRFIMGSPLLVDVFNQERWDYVYEYLPGSVFDEPVHRRVSLFFEDQLLVRVEGNIDAATPEELATPREQVVTVPDLPRNDGFFSGLNPFADDERRPLPARPAPAAESPEDETLANPAQAAIETDAEADAEAATSAASGADAEPIPDANDRDADDAEDVAGEGSKESEGGFFRGLAETFGFGDAAD